MSSEAFKKMIGSETNLKYLTWLAYSCLTCSIELRINMTWLTYY
jgi:hypothetical protein